MTWRRPALGTETLVLAGVVYVLAACNGPFWRAALAGRDLSDPGAFGFAIALFCALAALQVGLVCLVASRRTVRPMLAALLLLAAALSFYIDRYAVYFDRHMLRNVLATQWSEARELLGPALLGHLLLWGGLPALALWWPRLARRRPWQAAGIRSAWIVGAAAVLVASLAPVFADFASLMRNHKEVRHLLTPGNAVAAAALQAWGRDARAAGPLQPVATDARMAAARQSGRPALFVLVVGETARAANFSLDGYARATNPELAQRQVINFSQATACGTSTEVSLPCMFSVSGRAAYDEAAIRSHESLLHVLRRAGMQVLWRDNQSGCKGVCEGLPAEQLDRAGVPGLCPDGPCFDEVLLHGLDRIVGDAHGNLFVVLHQLGSHGPAYWRRYPPAFRHWTPACEQDELRRCSREEIVNAYDNSLLYTDHFLAALIDFLQARQDRFDTALLYVSDHGESLGESGLYLHGVPYPIAPPEQTHVPMLAWVSPSFARSAHLDLGCLRGRAGQPVSHDHLFHSLLGVLDVQTAAYQPGRDLFRPCRSVAVANAAS